MRYKVSLINVDFPLPDTPVMQLSKPTGNFRVTSLKLLPVALLILIQRDGFGGVRFLL